MALIIDTCNVLHRTGILPPDLAGGDVSSLLSLLSSSRYARKSTILACDWGPNNQKKESTEPWVRYVFPKHGKSADEIIIELVELSSAPRKLLVVTSDRRVAALARRGRARVIDSDRFLEQLAADAHRASSAPRSESKVTQVRDQDAQAWLDQFGVDEEMRSIERSNLPARPRTEPPGKPTPTPETATDPPLPPPEEWETLDTDELLRRYDRGAPPTDGST